MYTLQQFYKQATSTGNTPVRLSPSITTSEHISTMNQPQMVSGAAVYKKKIGLLTIYEDRTPSILQWRAADEGTMVEIVLTTVTRLQASSPESENMALKLITKPYDQVEPVNFLFVFNNRLIMDNVKEALQQIIARHKTAMETAQAEDARITAQPLINTSFLDEALDTKKLLKNLALQKKLLYDESSTQLAATFKDAVMEQGLAPEEFWKSRVHLLRAFALTNSQKKGPFNVLSTIKPTATADNQVNVSVTREKIHAIFEQYPVVRKAYDDNVPRLSEGEFWSRFFSSKLFRKLRGEKIATNVRGDVILDKYIHMDIDYEKHEDETLDHKVNKTIDLNGNQEDDSTKKGNGPDMTMKPDAIPETVAVLKSMNRLSHKMMNSLEMEYSRQSTPDLQKSKEEKELERIKEELVFQDLEQPHDTEYAEIHLNSESHVNKRPLPTKEQYITYTKDIQSQFDSPFALSEIYSNSKKPKIDTATNDILTLVRLNSKQSKQSWQVFRTFEEQQQHQVTDELDPSFDLKLLESLRITHATSIEFLRHFWLHFNSGDISQAATLNGLYKSLNKSIQRIDKAITEVQDEHSKVLAKAYFDPLKKSIMVAVSRYREEIKLLSAP